MTDDTIDAVTLLAVSLLGPIRDGQVQHLVDVLARLGDERMSVDQLALAVGARNRFALNRTLLSERLPAAGDLMAMMRVLTWWVRWNRDGKAISTQRLQAGHDSGHAYDTVARVTGLSWKDLCRGGPDLLLIRLREFVQAQRRLAHLRQAG